MFSQHAEISSNPYKLGEETEETQPCNILIYDNSEFYNLSFMLPNLGMWNSLERAREMISLLLILSFRPPLSKNLRTIYSIWFSTVLFRGKIKNQILGLFWMLKIDISSKWRRPETVCTFLCHHLNEKSAKCALETPMSWRGPPVWTTDSYLYEFITLFRGLLSLIQTSTLLTHEYFLCHMKPTRNS